MDTRGAAADFGHELAESLAAHTITAEADITKSPIHEHPVMLEPPYKAFDPRQTFLPTTRTPIIPDDAKTLVFQQVLLPPLDQPDWERSTALLTSIAGIKGPVNFELYATREQATFYLGTTPEEAAFINHAWLATYPESALRPTNDPIATLALNNIALCDLYSPEAYHRSIQHPPLLSPYQHFLRFTTNLGQNDTLFVQILMAPTTHPWQQNIASLLHAEHLLGTRCPLGKTSNPKDTTAPLFAAAIRIGSTTIGLRRALGAYAGTFTSEGKPFLYRTKEDYERTLGPSALPRLLRERTTHTTGQLLTPAELSVFVHVPDQRAGSIVHIDYVTGLCVPPSLQTTGLLVGTNNTRGDQQNVYESQAHENRCTWLLGASRMGKSKMIAHRISHLAQQGSGVGFLDPHRQTAFEVLHYLDGIAPERVVFLDFDNDHPVAYNPFATQREEEFGRLTTDYVNSLKILFGAENFHRMIHVLGMGVYALFALGENLALLLDLYARTTRGNDLRRRAAATVRNELVRSFWEHEYYTLSKDAFTPINNRLGSALLDERTYRTFAQQHNAVDIARIMDDQQVLIIAPPASKAPASIIGGMMIAEATHAAFRRVGTPRAQRHFQFIIDEFPWVITSATTLQSIIDETAKGGLSVCLANQETGQLPLDLLKAMFSIPNIYVFGINLPDAKPIAPLFNGQVAPETLAGQRRGQVHARLHGELVSFQATPPRTTTDHTLADRIIAYSKDHYYATPTSTPTMQASRARRQITTIPKD